MSAPATAVAARHAVDREHPWPGLAAFEEGDAELFKGRDAEVGALLRLIEREELSFLWGFSGLGKTSLLRAGLFPRLRAADIFPVYVRLDYAGRGQRAAGRAGGSADAPVALAEQCFDAMQLAASCWDYEIPEPAPSGTMWEYVRRREHRFWGPGDRLVTPLLVLDQFEELFTRDPRTGIAAEHIDAFFRDVSDAVRGCPPAWLLEAGTGTPLESEGDYLYRPGALKVLLSFREDYLAQVTGLSPLVSALDGNHFRLTSMTFEQAVDAVQQAGGHLIDASSPDENRAVCERIVARVSGASSVMAQRSATVDPALLSLFCSELNERRLAGAEHAVIDRALVEGAEASQIISRFYESCMSQVSAAARRFVEDRLVLPESRARESLAVETALQSGVTREDLTFLSDKKRILRREHSLRQGQARLELTHDVLVEPALAARDRRRAEEARAAEAQARLEEEARRQEEQAREAAERDRQRRELEALRERLALESSVAEAREAASRAEADRQREALQAARREHELALTFARAQEASRRRRSYLVAGLVAMAAIVGLLVIGADRERRANDQRSAAATLERAIDDAGSARPVQALARLAKVIRQRPDDVAARSIALDLLLRRTWLLPVATLDLPAGPIELAINGDADLVATASASGALRLWRTDTGAPVGPAREHGAAIQLVRFARGGPTRLLTVAADGVARVWSETGAAPLATIRHTGAITEAIFGPQPTIDAVGDGAIVTTASGNDGWVRVWGIREDQPPRELHSVRYDGAVRQLAVSRAGQTLLALAGNAVTMWRPGSGDPVRLAHDRAETVTTSAFSPDGRLVATGTSSGFLRIWSVDTRLVVGSARCEGELRRLVFDGSGRQLMSIVTRPWATVESTATIWRVPVLGDPADTRLERTIAIRSADPDEDGAFIDDTLVVMRTEAGSVRLADTRTGMPLALPLRLAATSLRLDGGARRLVIARRQQPPATWVVRRPVPSLELATSQGVVSAQFSPHGRILTASLDGTARIWPATGGLPDVELSAEQRLVDAEFSRDGRLVLTNHGSMVHTWTPEGRLLASIPAGSGPILLAKFDPQGTRLVTASNMGVAAVWDSRTGARVSERHVGGSLWAAEFSPQGDRVVAASSDGHAEVWDAVTGRPVGPPMTHGEPVVDARFSRDGTRVVTASSDTTARVWNVGSADPPIVLRHSDRLTSARFGADATRVVTTSTDWTARIWTLQGGDPRVVVLPHEGPVDRAELDADARRLLTVSSRTGTIRIWDVERGLPLLQVSPAQSLLWSARFSPDGERVVTAWDDGYARVFEVPTGAGADAGWIASLAEAVGGRHVDDTGATVAIPNQGARLAEFRAGAPQSQFRQRLLRWLLLEGAAGF